MPPSTGISQLVEKVAGQKATDPIILLAELFLLFKELTEKKKDCRISIHWGIYCCTILTRQTNTCWTQMICSIMSGT